MPFMLPKSHLLPNAKRDLLMLDPSRKRAPRKPVTAPLSDPAKSIIDSLAIDTLDLTSEERAC